MLRQRAKASSWKYPKVTAVKFLVPSTPTKSSFQAISIVLVVETNCLKLVIQCIHLAANCCEETYSLPYLFLLGQKTPADCWSTTGYRVRLHRSVMLNCWSVKHQILQEQRSPGGLKSPGAIQLEGYKKEEASTPALGAGLLWAFEACLSGCGALRGFLLFHREARVCLGTSGWLANLSAICF